MTYRKKLIEVALPLKAINEASVREKSIRHGHPSTLHLWWSRKPLATCRAVLFASLVDDPCSDLNPLAVLISKALFEIPPKFAGRAPVNPEAKQSLMGRDWHGAQGLADDIRYYGKWMRDDAERRIAYLYPKVTLPKEYGNGEATVIAWLWVRTVRCPNPACGVQMPLTSKWWLSKKKEKEAWVEPHVNHAISPPTIQFNVKAGKEQPQAGTVNRQGAICIACKTPVPFEYRR